MEDGFLPYPSGGAGCLLQEGLSTGARLRRLGLYFQSRGLVPLAPREVYYGRGHHGPHSVNITNVNVTNVHVDKVVYKT